MNWAVLMIAGYRAMSRVTVLNANDSTKDVVLMFHFD